MRNSEFEFSGASVSVDRNFYLVTALIGAIALSIRWTIAEGDSLWLDELHTAWAVDGHLPKVAGRAADGNQNPLFFWLTWIVAQLFGRGHLALRLISVVAGTAVVGVAGCFAWRGSECADRNQSWVSWSPV